MIRALVTLLTLVPLACAGGGAEKPAAPEPEFSVFVTGGLRNQLDNCGCRERMGGHIRRSTAFLEYGRAHPAARLFYIDCGQTLKPDGYDFSYAAPFLKEALRDLHLNVINAGTDEISMGTAPLDAAVEGESFTVTSANLRRIDSGEPHYPTFAVATPHSVDGKPTAGPRLGLVGLTVPDRYRVLDGGAGAKLHFTDPLAAAAEVVPKVKPQCDALILFGSFGHGLARQLAEQHKEADLIVATDLNIGEIESEPGQEIPVYFTGLRGRRQLRFDFYREASPGRRWKVVANVTTLNDSLGLNPQAQALMQRYGAAAAAAGYGRGLNLKTPEEPGS